MTYVDTIFAEEEEEARLMQQNWINAVYDKEKEEYY